MRYLITTILLALAPLSWGEDVYYCVEDLAYSIGKDDSQRGPVKLQQYVKEKFTFKYQADSHRLVFKGKTFAADKNYLECEQCASSGAFQALDTFSRFRMFALGGEGRFFLTFNTFASARMTTGTCVKF